MPMFVSTLPLLIMVLCGVGAHQQAQEAADSATAMARTVHGCQCVRPVDCNTSAFHEGRKWCRTVEARCVHDVLWHDWDYCETWDQVVAGRGMCDVYAERGHHPQCSTARMGGGGQGLEGLVILVMHLVNYFSSCWFRCTSWTEQALWIVKTWGVIVVGCVLVKVALNYSGQRTKIG